MRTRRYVIELLIGLFCALVINGLSPVGAASANISHSYKADSSIPVGSLVSLSSEKQGFIEQANTNNSARLLGVAVQSNDSLLAVDASQGSVQVATDGTASALVSSLNGAINVGDEVAVSPFDGIGMKYIPGYRIAGLAQTAFDGSSGVSEKVTDKSGKSSNIKIGYVKISIGITNVVSDNANIQPNNALQKYALSLTGHTVASWRVEVSAVVVMVAFIALVTLMYSSIYGSIVSVGRNPLAKFTIFRTLRAVTGMAIVTAGLASLTVYLLMR